jgi:hypothetical protein
VVALVIAPSIANDSAVATYVEEKLNQEQAIEMVSPEINEIKETNQTEEVLEFSFVLEREIMQIVKAKKDC